MPKPRAKEKKDEFIKRCIPILIKEGRKKDQAIAICHSLFKNRKK